MGRFDEMDETIEELKKEIAKLTQERDIATSAMNNLARKLTATEQERDSEQKKCAELEAALAFQDTGLKKELAAARQERDEAIRRAEEAEKRVSDLKKDVQGLSDAKQKFVYISAGKFVENYKLEQEIERLRPLAGADISEAMWEARNKQIEQLEQDNAALREKVKVLEKCKTRITFDAPGAAEMVKLLRDNNAALRQRICELEAGKVGREAITDAVKAILLDDFPVSIELTLKLQIVERIADAILRQVNGEGK